MNRLCVFLSGVMAFGSVVLWAAPVEWEGFAADGWHIRPRVQADGSIRELRAGGSLTQSITLAEPGDKEKEFGGKWRVIVGMECYGHTGQVPARLALEALDPASGEVFASGTATISQPLPRPAWAIVSSSVAAETAADEAYDRDPTTVWRSRGGDGEAKDGAWIGMEFGKPVDVSGMRYTPPQPSAAKGAMKDFRVEARAPGGEWRVVAKGQSAATRRGEPHEVALTDAAGVEAVRLVVESDWGNSGTAAAAEVEWQGVVLDPLPTLQSESPRRAVGGVWLEIPAELTALLAGKTFALRLRNSQDSGVAVGPASAARVSLKPTGDLFGRSNGGLGPDKLGAGLLGFDALTEHRQSVLTVMTVHPRSAAGRVKLKEGDAIVSAGGVPMPVNDLAPGWNWLENSHEAFLGRQSEAALAAGRNVLPLGVLREGVVEVLNVPLNRTRPFHTMNPADDPEAAALLRDLVKFLADTQRDNGSWSDCIIRTTFSALALLATEDSRHRARVRKAVQWAQGRYAKPADYGNLGFWSAGYAGILYGEYHLATGDRSVLRNINELRQWAVGGSHKSAWDVPALGHGPDGLPYENKALVAPACHLLVAEALGKRAGLESGIWEMLMPYMEMAWSDPKEGGHGALGYNRSYKDTEEFWSRTGLFAMACHLRNERFDMRDAMVAMMEKNHPWIRNSHAYGEPGGALGLLGLQLVNPEAYAGIIRQYAWWFSLAWEPGHGLHFTTPHMGAPYMGEQDLINAAYALVLQSPKRNLAITGRTGDSR